MRQLAQSIQDDSRSENLGQQPGIGLSGHVERVGRYAVAAECGQRLGDGGVIAGPVGAEKSYVAAGEGVFDFRPAQGHALVHLAGEAPGRGEIDKSGPACGKGALDGAGGPGLP